MAAAALLGAAVRTLLPLGLGLTLALSAGAARAELYYLIVGGLGGDPVYAESFAGSASVMAEAARRTNGDDARIKVLSGESATREALQAAFAEIAARTVATDRSSSVTAAMTAPTTSSI
jgi:hypothetical protein